MTNRWNVWSKDPSRPVWMVVDSGSERDSIEGAERRQKAALRLGVSDAKFLALPAGKEPPAEEEG